MAESSPDQPRIAVAGATGYTGALAAQLIDGHPSFELASITSQSASGRRLTEFYPDHPVERKLEPFDADQVAESADAAVVAYPHGEAGPVAAELRGRGVKVVDLSGDHRLPPDRYERHYGRQAVAELWEEAVYGLPELHRTEIRDAELIANPGCYATAAILALAPLRERLTEVIIDGKSGTSGAGRHAHVGLQSRAYNVDGHPHLGELEQELREDIPITFVPHLSPEFEGLTVTCYATLDDELPQIDLYNLFEAAYGREPFVLLQLEPPGTDSVRYTNRCRISVHAQRGTNRAIICAAIDNLWKGASGQAVQNLNLMFEQDERAGLERCLTQP